MKKKIILSSGMILLLMSAAVAIFIYSQLPKQIEGAYFDADGVRIHYTDQGTGEAVVLVHGFAANQDMNWRQPGILQALAEDYRVIALDNRGHGLSGKPHGVSNYGLEMPRDIIRLLDHLGIEKAHVVGYSMGGFITLKLLTMYPERLLSAAPCGMAWGELTTERSEKIEEIASALEAGNGFGPLIELLGLKMDADSTRSRFGQIIFNIYNDVDALASVMRSMRELVVDEAALRSNTVPTLTVVGSADPMSEDAEKMKAIMACHRLVYVDGAGHMATPRRPEFLEAIRAFLKENEQTTRTVAVP